jgi:hypothetical protein
MTPGCLQATAEVPDVEITRQNIEIPATPALVPDGTVVTFQKEFKYDEAPVDLPDNVTLDMHATEITLSLREGPTDLSFMHAASLTVSKSGAAAETVIDYQRGSEAVGTSVTLPVQGDPKLLDPWSVQDATFVLTLTGELPKVAWSVDISIRFSGKVSYSM